MVEAAEAFAAAAVRERAFAASDRELEDAVGVADETVRLVQAGMVGITREAVTRGLPREHGYSTHDWLDLHAPGLARVNRCAITTVAAGLDHPDPATRSAHRRLEEDVENGTLGIHRARRLLLSLGRVRPHVDDATYTEDVEILRPLALHGSEKDLERATSGLIAVAVPLQDRGAAATAAFDARTVEEHRIRSDQLGIDLYELRVRCDAEGAAILQALFASPLAAPNPDPETGTPDPRDAGQRRYDALVTAVGRGVSAPVGAPGTQKATVVITMTMDQLTGDSRVPTTSGTGQVLTPEEARRAACDAGIVPVVLGGRSQVLDVGRASRLATSAQVTALRIRDGGCTYPGCSAPPGWCDAHHLVHWSRGGATDLDNLTLLCRRHHTLVHHTHPAWTLEHPPRPPTRPGTGSPKDPAITRAARIRWNL